MKIGPWQVNEVLRKCENLAMLVARESKEAWEAGGWDEECRMQVRRTQQASGG